MTSALVCVPTYFLFFEQLYSTIFIDLALFWKFLSEDVVFEMNKLLSSSRREITAQGAALQYSVPNVIPHSYQAKNS